MAFFTKVRAAIVSNLEKWLIHGGKGQFSTWTGMTSSGMVMTEESAAAVGMHVTCTRVRNEDLGSLPLHVYRRDKRDRDLREVATEHPLYPVLHQSPNPLQTKMEFFEQLGAFVSTWGNAYAYMDLDSRQNVAALWPLMPWQVTASRPEGAFSTGVAYTYRDAKGAETSLDPARVLHVRGLGTDPIRGKSVVEQFAETLGMNRAVQMYGAKFFANNARGDLYFKHPGKLSSEALNRLRESIASKNSGPDGWHRPMVLEEGMQPEAVSLPLKDLMLLEAMKATELQICGWHRMPPHKVGILDRATFSNIEQQEIQYVTGVVRPDCVRLEQAIMRCCFGPKEGREYFVEHSIEGLLRGDLKSRYEAYAVGLNSGFMVPSTITRRENLPPVQGGDWVRIPANMNIFDAQGNLVIEAKKPEQQPAPKGANNNA